MDSGQAKRQREGGHIGFRFTGHVAQVLMCRWHKRLIEELMENGMDVLMYNRAGCDINMVFRRGDVVIDDVRKPSGLWTLWHR